jgi:hypothetical protein
VTKKLVIKQVAKQNKNIIKRKITIDNYVKTEKTNRAANGLLTSNQKANTSPRLDNWLWEHGSVGLTLSTLDGEGGGQFLAPSGLSPYQLDRLLCGLKNLSGRSGWEENLGRLYTD